MGTPICRWSIILMGLLSSITAFGGNENGGGGNSIVCRGQDYAVKSVELLDLYEGRVLKELTYPNSYKEGMELEVAKLILTKGHVTTVNGETVEEFYSRIKFLPKKTKLPPTDDFNTAAPIPLGCEVEGVANYQYKKDGNIYVNPDLWDAMDVLNRGALIAHEIAYRYLRFNREKNSDRARQLVALTYSTIEIPAVDDGIPEYEPGNIEICTTDDETDEKYNTAVFRTLPQSDGTILVQFFELMGRVALAKTTVVAEGQWPVSDGNNIFVDFQPLNSVIESPNEQVQIMVSADGEHREIAFWNGERSIHASFSCSRY